jgi:hypothetical protein
VASDGAVRRGKAADASDLPLCPRPYRREETVHVLGAVHRLKRVHLGPPDAMKTIHVRRQNEIIPLAGTCS